MQFLTLISKGLGWIANVGINSSKQADNDNMLHIVVLRMEDRRILDGNQNDVRLTEGEKCRNSNSPCLHFRRS